VLTMIQNDAAMIVHRDRIADAIDRQITGSVARTRRRGVRIVIGRRPREGERIVIAIARSS
jgi:RecB family endonuclease NucS